MLGDRLTEASRRRAANGLHPRSSIELSVAVMLREHHDAFGEVIEICRRHRYEGSGMTRRQRDGRAPDRVGVTTEQANPVTRPYKCLATADP